MVYVKSLKPNNEKAESFSKAEWKISLIGFILFLLLIFCSVFYIKETNAVAVKGFEIKDIEFAIEKEKIKSQDLQLITANLKTINNLRGNISKLEMVKVSQIDYISGGGSTAMAR